LQRVRGYFDAVAGIPFSRSGAARRWRWSAIGLRQDDHREGDRAVAARVARTDGRVLLRRPQSVRAAGQDLVTARRPVQIIFQDPFASLNPRMRVFDLPRRRADRLAPATSMRPRAAGASSA